MPSNNHYDQGARYVAKLDPARLLQHWLRLSANALRFREWLDTRMVPFPGEPDRTCDTVAFLEDASAGNVPWAIAIEFQLEADPLMFGRLLGYLSGLWLQMRPSAERGDRYNVGAVVVHLRGRGQSSREYAWPDAGLKTQLQVREVVLAEEVAEEVLEKIAQGTATRALLPMIPLMQGGGSSVNIAEWLRLATAEPNAQKRGDYGGLALVFAEAAGCRSYWQNALKGWNMIQSKQVLEWQEQARNEGLVLGRNEGLVLGRNEGLVLGQAEMLLAFLADKFGAVPAEVTSAVRAMPNLQILRQLATLLSRAESLDEFRRQAKL